MLGLRFCARAFSSCGERGPLFIAVSGPPTIAASLAAEHRLQTRRLSSCGSRAQLLHGMWDLPRLGLEPVPPALAGRFSTTAPPGKPYQFIIKDIVKDTDEQPDEEVHRARSRRVLSAKNSVPVELGYTTFPSSDVSANLEVHQILLFKSFYRA